ncbi:EamA-like transporter family protein [Salana multivorans]|uniref:EamA-like transporter family protein n=1 Tax=Salana multivorans TaxID=120377 RepID=A0A3N2D7R1_9MICO|nr:DMT family transporter [Salana multivorans]ROR95742.1 EamA-like transporter family protein [Salana multivorans]
MKFGILSGLTWGLDTVILSMALVLVPFFGAPEAAISSAFLHDLACAVILFVYMGIKGRLRATMSAAKTRSGRAVMGAALLGGPVGMTGYLIAINNIGPGFTAIISSFYPAFGAVLAFIFLKERMRLGQFIALLVALAGVITIGWVSTDSETPGLAIVGILAALMCVVGWGSEAVILAWAMKDDIVDNETALQIRETTSALVYAAVLLPVFGAFRFSFNAIPTPAMGVLTIAAVAGTASYLFYYTAINRIGAARSMALNISYSAWAVVFGVILLGAIPSPIVIVCCLVILVGTVLAASPNWRELRFWRGGPPSGGDSDKDDVVAATS